MKSSKWIVAVLSLSIALVAHAQTNNLTKCKEQANWKISGTKFGYISEFQCNEEGRDITKFVLNKQLILFGGEGTISSEADNATKAADYRDGTLFVFQGRTESYEDRRCPACLYLLDFTGDKPRVFSFGVKNASNQFHWASWGKKRSVIAIKKNVKFVYENGKLTPPKKDNDLYLNIKPTMFETPVEKLEPFVEKLPIQ